MKNNMPNMGNFKESISRVVKACVNVLKDEGKKALSSIKEIEHVEGPFYKNIHFNVHHFVTLSLVALLAFFVTLYSTGHNTSVVNAASLEAPTVETFNKKAVKVSYGDNQSVANLAKDILGQNVSAVSEPQQVKSDGMTTVYEIENYVVNVTVDGSNKLGKMGAVVSIQDKETATKQDSQKIVVTDQAVIDEVQTGTVYNYNVDLKIVDTEAPKITLWSDDTTIDDIDDYDVEDYIKSVTDNVDGVIDIKDLKIKHDVKRVGKKLKAGHYDVEITATDSSGNSTTEILIVRCYETEEDEIVDNSSNPASEGSNSYGNDASDSYGSNNSYGSNSYGYSGGGSVGSYAGSGSILSAAYAQLGAAQDCTALVSNSLAAAGIYYHGWPAGYLSLGTVVSASEAQPGDVIYYANGGCGVPHVAIYAGGGQAIHGGWNGCGTVKTTAYVGSGPVFVRVGR